MFGLLLVAFDGQGKNDRKGHQIFQEKEKFSCVKQFQSTVGKEVFFFLRKKKNEKIIVVF